MSFLKRYPIPIAGLILGLFALGNLIQSYSTEARHVLGLIAFILYVPYLLKILCLNTKLSEPLDNPVAASVFPTFTMATMLLAGYIKPYSPECANIIWYAGVIFHVLLIIWFTFKFVVRNFAIKKVFPSWFIVYVGIAVASVSAPVTGNLDIGQYAFWFGLITYILLLIVVCKRVFLVGEIPAPAQPTTVIFAAPASLLLAGYMVSFPEKISWLVYALLACSIFFWAVGMIYLLKTFSFKFIPSHSAFTFPLVISALAVKLSANFTSLSWQGILYEIQTVIALVIVLWVLVRYVMFLFAKSE
ncbi:MAG: TDT family transporter [Synergistaceae bacterium]|nr:TDT family transporter [Synergistaceae bacterium]